jgi:hypothetical protein
LTAESILWRFSNGGDAPPIIWLEPWAEEFIVPPRGEIALRVESDEPALACLPEIDVSDRGLVAYAAGGTRIVVVIDGVEQDSGSCVLTAPGFEPLSTRGFIHTVFDKIPEARPGGIILPAPAPRTRGFIGLLARLFRPG